jgi:Domain of unknown function (DUF4291)
MNERVIRALYDEKNITVYQAYNKAIAEAAIKAQCFISPPFKKDRMTWIKPSFLWMMYRSGWATKENQEHVLAIKVKREGFNWALQNACLSHFDKTIHASYDNWKLKLHDAPVRIQWDPEKDIFSNPLPYRSIQIGLSGIAVEKYILEWVQSIHDITGYCKNIQQLINANEVNQARELLPLEKLYPVSKNIIQK